MGHSNDEEISNIGKVKPDLRKDVDLSQAYYNINDGRKKMAFIFNHLSYEKIDGKRPSKRIGTDKDLESLTKCFTQLGFHVTPYHDKKSAEIKSIVNNESKFYFIFNKTNLNKMFKLFNFKNFNYPRKKAEA